jgi:hypothetical protein
MGILQPAVSNRAVAKMLGVGSRTVDRDITPNDALFDEIVEENQSRLASNGASGAEAARLVQKTEKAPAEREQRREE